MSASHNKHPAIIYNQQISEICRPLQKLNISYFSHVKIDREGNFSVICNNPAFLEHYIKKKYYNADIHMAGSNTFGNIIVWDAINRQGKTKQMEAEAAQLGVQHTFTILEQSSESYDYYHFSNDSNDGSINQTYLSNLDLLKYFTQHFSEKINRDKCISESYQIKYRPDYENGKFDFHHNTNFVLLDEERMQFIESLNLSQSTHENDKHLSILKKSCQTLSNRETQVLLLMIKGKSARAISEELKLSCRTIEHYIVNIKIKTGIDSKVDLIGMFIDKLLAA